MMRPVSAIAYRGQGYLFSKPVPGEVFAKKFLTALEIVRG